MYGQKQEVIARDYLRSTGVTVQETGMFVSKTEHWLSASPDGIIDQDTLLEIKSPFPEKWSTLDELISAGKYDVIATENGYQLKTKGSRGFYSQMQLTMYCTGLRKCKLLLWRCSDDHKLIDIDYNQIYVENQIERLKKFYFTKMLHRIVDDVDSDRLILCRTFRNFMAN